MNTQTIEQLIENIEKGLYLAAGTDVQIHAEDALMFALRAAYTMYIEEGFIYSNLHFRTDDIDSNTGMIVGTYNDDCRDFSDIHSIYFNKDTVQATILAPRTNPLAVTRANCVFPLQDNPAKLFRVLNPSADKVSIWYRKRVPENVWTDHRIEIVLDVDALLLQYAVIYQFLVDENSNDRAIMNARQNVEMRRKQLRDREWQHAQDKFSQAASIPTEWY